MDESLSIRCPPETVPGLYNGADLAAAARRSNVRGLPENSLSGLGNALTILGRLALEHFAAGNRQCYEFVLAKGEVSGSDSVTAAYVGTGANREWCLSALFTRYRETQVRSCGSPADCTKLLQDVYGKASVLFTDAMPPHELSKMERPFLLMPAWVKQRLRIRADWSEQLAGMRRATRQETARILRKHGYVSRLTRADVDFESFYRRFYVPYMTFRFGQSAIVVDEPSFLRECRRGTLLQLAHDSRIVGNALLRRVGQTLAIVWSAPDPDAGHSEIRGITDALDYFSMLYAHLKGCRWLDFGPSRPDLRDGTLMYKRKWGTEITSGFAPQVTIGVSCSGRHDAEKDFLRRHTFISRGTGGLAATAFVDGDIASGDLRTILRRMQTAGLGDPRIVAFSPVGDALRQVTSESGNLSHAEARTARDAIAACSA